MRRGRQRLAVWMDACAAAACRPSRSALRRAAGRATGGAVHPVFPWLVPGVALRAGGWRRTGVRCLSRSAGGVGRMAS
ncbi:hypothetical protein, partial [Loktanella salsilacus]|uniref:hypothetical protein n=1 Tax=Loktanella salsilacus TaxID=195913 RepID=UPI003989C37F